MSERLVAIDLGAESGRVIVGTLSGGRLGLEVVHRFPTSQLTVGDSLRWDARAIFAEIRRGLALAAAGGPIRSIGVDSWGVDYALIDAAGELVEPPYVYRDKRTTGVIEELTARFGGALPLFQRSGVHAMVINTLPQLVAHLRQDPGALARAAHIVSFSDLLHFWLCGEVAWERTQAGTSQLCRPGAEAWDDELITAVGLPLAKFAPIRASGTVLGRLRPALAAEFGLAAAPDVVLPGNHDTACAVAGTPFDAESGAYVSSGTWSLIGCIHPRPVLDEAFRACGLSNEIAVDGRIRLNRNIMGLWLVQECRRAFVAAGREASYQELSDLAAAEPASARPLDVDDQRFLYSSLVGDDMPSRIRAWCREHGQPEPASDAALVRTCLDGLADAYRRAIADLERFAGRRLATLHVAGGGSNNHLLNQLTADACARPVLAGPAEATALGNLLVQARGLGLIASPAAAAAVLAASVEVRRYEPRPQRAREHGHRRAD